MPNQIKLSFSPDLSLNAKGKHVRDGLSTALLLGDNLWLSCDERLWNASPACPTALLASTRM